MREALRVNHWALHAHLSTISPWEYASSSSVISNRQLGAPAIAAIKYCGRDHVGGYMRGSEFRVRGTRTVDTTALPQLT